MCIFFHRRAGGCLSHLLQQSAKPLLVTFLQISLELWPTQDRLPAEGEPLETWMHMHVLNRSGLDSVRSTFNWQLHAALQVHF